jgi:hypothetical protein
LPLLSPSCDPSWKSSPASLTNPPHHTINSSVVSIFPFWWLFWCCRDEPRALHMLITSCTTELHTPRPPKHLISFHPQLDHISCCLPLGSGTRCLEFSFLPSLLLQFSTWLTPIQQPWKQ